MMSASVTTQKDALTERTINFVDILIRGLTVSLEEVLARLNSDEKKTRDEARMEAFSLMREAQATDIDRLEQAIEALRLAGGRVSDALSKTNGQAPELGSK